MGAPEILTQPSPETLAEAVAGRLVTRLAGAQADGRVPCIALTGGTVAVRVHQALVGASADQVDWSRVDVWWGDERYVAADDAERNAHQACRRTARPRRRQPGPRPRDAGLGRGHPSLDAAATSYGDELRAEGAGLFDVVMLGLGTDGHVASLFPGFPQLDVHDTVAVPVTGSPTATGADQPDLRGPEPGPGGVVRGRR